MSGAYLLRGDLESSTTNLSLPRSPANVMLTKIESRPDAALDEYVFRVFKVDSILTEDPLHERGRITSISVKRGPTEAVMLAEPPGRLILTFDFPFYVLSTTVASSLHFPLCKSTTRMASRESPLKRLLHKRLQHYSLLS